jgi:hypothetical protein
MPELTNIATGMEVRPGRRSVFVRWRKAGKLGGRRDGGLVKAVFLAVRTSKRRRWNSIVLKKSKSDSMRISMGSISLAALYPLKIHAIPWRSLDHCCGRIEFPESGRSNGSATLLYTCQKSHIFQLVYSMLITPQILYVKGVENEWH